MRRSLSIFFVLLSLNIFSDSYLDVISHLSKEEMNVLQEKGYVLNESVPNFESIKLLPSEFSFRDDFIEAYNEYNPELSIEILYLIEKPDSGDKDLSMFLQENILAVSEQEGIEYFSHNRNRMHPLIKKSYFFNNNKKNKIDDPIITEYKSERNFELFQEDTTFGGNEYSLNSKLSNQDGTVWNEMINESAMRVFFVFKAIDPRGLKVSYVIIPMEDKILLYALAQIQEPPKVKEILGRKVNIPDSFRKRVDRVIQWYIKRINNKSEEK